MDDTPIKFMTLKEEIVRQKDKLSLKLDNKNKTLKFLEEDSEQLYNLSNISYEIYELKNKLNFLNKLTCILPLNEVKSN